MMTTITHPFGNVYDGHPSCCTAEHIKTRSSDADTERDVHEVYKCVKLAEFVNRPPDPASRSAGHPGCEDVDLPRSRVARFPRD